MNEMIWAVNINNQPNNQSVNQFCYNCQGSYLALEIHNKGLALLQICYSCSIFGVLSLAQVAGI